MSSVALLHVPPEVLEAIFQYVPRKDLKNFALAGSVALEIVSPFLYRRLSLRLVAVPHECTSSRRYPCCEEHSLDVEVVESVLNSTPRALGYVRDFVISSPARLPRRVGGHPAPPPHIPPGDIMGRQRGALSDREDFMLRMVFQKLGSAQLENFRSISIPNCDISAKCFGLILRTQPNLRVLKLGRVGVQKRHDYGELAELERSQEPLKLECLEFGEFKEEMVLPLLQTFRRCSGSLRELKIGSISPGFIRNNTLGARFSPGSREIELRKRSNERISLPYLEKIRICYDGMFPGFLDLFGGLAQNFHRLNRVKVDSCDYSHNFIANLVDKAGANIRSFQGTSCFWAAGSLSTLLPKLQSLHTLLLNCHGNIFISDIEPVFSYRESLKRLWFGCGIPGVRSEEPECLCVETFFDSELSRYPLTSENWPLLEELAMPHCTIDKIPLIHNLRVLRLTYALGEAGRPHHESEYSIPRYIKKLWDYSTSHYNQVPKLEVVVVSSGRISDRFADPDHCSMAFFVLRYEGLGGLEKPKVKRYNNDLSKVLKYSSWSHLFSPRHAALDFWEDSGPSLYPRDGAYNVDDMNLVRRYDSDDTTTLPMIDRFHMQPYRARAIESDIDLDSEVDGGLFR
ncbi:hypothetical protein DRE_02952 [Drechslerella stenobrocha 248]|uniref:F-box domain-containing protein n=1 Tax=Drechslerella stenobrocha 248 TaxID=1043628 RepID=W7I5L1_9PEZI|nr:hypothetical protein DRE_02952 [Drechslerella stenobrocha 248]